MRNILFFLLPIITFGTAIYVYFYFRQEQDKVIRKDKYDEARNELNKKGIKNKILDIRFVAHSGLPNSANISIGLGLLSCITFISSTDSIDSMYSVLTSSIGFIAAIIGLFIGFFGLLQTKNESSSLKYGGVLLSTIGLGNIIYSSDFFFSIFLHLLFFILIPFLGD
jgi:hypothetical protein